MLNKGKSVRPRLGSKIARLRVESSVGKEAVIWAGAICGQSVSSVSVPTARRAPLRLLHRVPLSDGPFLGTFSL